MTANETSWLTFYQIHAELDPILRPRDEESPELTKKRRSDHKAYWNNRKRLDSKAYREKRRRTVDAFLTENPFAITYQEWRTREARRHNVHVHTVHIWRDRGKYPNIKVKRITKSTVYVLNP